MSAKVMVSHYIPQKQIDRFSAQAVVALKAFPFQVLLQSRDKVAMLDLKF